MSALGQRDKEELGVEGEWGGQGKEAEDGEGFAEERWGRCGWKFGEWERRESGGGKKGQHKKEERMLRMMKRKVKGNKGEVGRMDGG